MRYDYKGDFYELYQVDEDKAGQEYIFMNMDYVKRHGYEVTREHYKLVYDDFLEERDTLESLYARFNIEHPEDFRGHSMSVSDVVVLYKDGEVKSYYVDSIGFAEVPEFLMKPELQKGGAEQENGFSLNDEVLLGARVYESRTREGLYRENSDINVVLSYQGTIEEERLQNIIW